MATGAATNGEGRARARVAARGEDVWALSAAEVCGDVLGVDPDDGLSDLLGEVESRRIQHGFNELEKASAKPLWRLVLEQFDDALVKILLAAALVSFALAVFEEKAMPMGEGAHAAGPWTVDSLKAFVEPFVIVLILLLNAVVGVWQESNAEKALAALQELNHATALCLRDGKWEDLAARDLVPGDIVKLGVGDKVPADGRVVRLATATVRVEQASLTGESVPVEKVAEAIADLGDGDGDHLELQAKKNMVFAGTSVANGSCIFAVTHTGELTELGKTHALIRDAQDEEDDATPLQKKLDEFGDQLSKIIGVICLIVWAINYHQFLKLTFPPGAWIPSSVSFDLVKCTYYFKIAVALAVAAIPEGLPAVITTCLALGTRKMAKQNAIVRKLPSVETLGCTSVICSDKTGTLTSNQMSVVELVAVGASSGGQLLERHAVSGHTYDPRGGEVHGVDKLSENMKAIIKVCALCNDSGVEAKDCGSAESEGSGRPGQMRQYRARGSPTEAALVVLAEKMARLDGADWQADGDDEDLCDPATKCIISEHNKLATLEFNRDRKSMSVIVNQTSASSGAKNKVPSLVSPRRDLGALRRVLRSRQDGKAKNTLLVKGAPESVLDRCTSVMLSNGRKVALKPAMKEEIESVTEKMSSRALRCLAFALKDHSDLDESLASYNGTSSHPGHAVVADPSVYAEVESGLCFLGLAGLEDPPRPEVRQAVASCKAAGIRVMVITGDNQLTAESICKQVGILGEDDDLSVRSFTCAQFSRMTVDKQLKVLKRTRGGLVFSRAEPKHKQDIIRLLKSNEDDVIAMTGDGVNDAPALALADIGVAMGIAGTEVAKEASDMVLADDNFSTIVSAVKEGRSIYNNMKAFIRYMISSNIGEVASIFLTAALGLPEGLIPVQLLWVNLVTDGPPATALGFNPPDPDVMDKRPRSNTDSLITSWILFRYMVVGLYVGAATVGIFACWYTNTEFMGIDLSKDGHTPISWHQLTHWDQCEKWENFYAAPYTAGDKVYRFDGDPCAYLGEGKAKASTLSLTVLVAIEMFNSLNALSEDQGLWRVPPWVNPYLLIAIFVSFALHFLILYVPSLTDIFAITPLSWEEWMLVLLFSLPVIAIDEVLKCMGRAINKREQKKHKIE